MTTSHPSPLDASAIEHLSLYYYDGCFFCLRVLRALDELGVTVELRNVLLNEQHRRDLVAATGRRRVPVLRIRQQDGQERWMPESHDIVAFLRHHFTL